MQADPSGASEAVTYDVLHRHIGGEATAIVDVRGFPEGRVGAAYVMVVTAKHDRASKFAAGNGVIEGLRNLDPTLGIGVKDSGLRADDGQVTVGIFYPNDIVVELALDFGGGSCLNSLQNLCGDSVRFI